MKWTKHKIEVKDLDTFYNTYIKVVNKGEIKLDHFYCVLLCADMNTICMYSIFDFLDLYRQQVLTKDIIKILYTYQVLNS